MYHAINVNICTNFKDIDWLDPMNKTYHSCSRNFRIFLTISSIDDCIWWRHINFMIFVFDISNNEEREKCCKYILHNKHKICKKIIVGVKTLPGTNSINEIHQFCDQHDVIYIEIEKNDIEQWNNHLSKHIIEFVKCMMTKHDNVHCCRIC